MFTNLFQSGYWLLGIFLTSVGPVAVGCYFAVHIGGYSLLFAAIRADTGCSSDTDLSEGDATMEDAFCNLY
jgi:hypothetical protein